MSRMEIHTSPQNRPHTPCYMGPRFGVSQIGERNFAPIVELDTGPVATEKRYATYGEAFEVAYRVSRNYGAGVE